VHPKFARDGASPIDASHAPLAAAPAATPAAARTSVTRWTLLALVCCTLFTLGCTTGGRVTLRSAADPERVVAPQLRTAVFRRAGPNTVDVYLTNLSRRDLDPLADLSIVSGHIVHMHMFLAPSPGKTPIATTATNTTVRHLIVSRGVVGVYEGAGFLLPGFSAGAEEFRGALRSASLRLLRADPGFADPLGAAEFSATMHAAEDPAKAELIARRLEQEVGRLPTIRPAGDE
jgi:hypothetical protein